MAAEIGSSSAGSKERSNRFVWWFSVLATFLVVMVGAIVAWPEWFGFDKKQVSDYQRLPVPAAVPEQLPGLLGSCTNSNVRTKKYRRKPR